MDCSDTGSRNRPVMLHGHTEMDAPVVYEMGRVYAGTTAEFVLNLKNTGKSAVVVNEARTFCGCTLPEFNPEPVPPGEYSRIRVTFLAEQPGIFDKEVRIFLNSREEPLKLILRGEVIRNKK